jgi:hypothetical protein
MRLPHTDTVPLVAGSSPCRMRSSVVLPQPLGPITETNSPAVLVALGQSTPGRRFWKD